VTANPAGDEAPRRRIGPEDLLPDSEAELKRLEEALRQSSQALRALEERNTSLIAELEQARRGGALRREADDEAGGRIVELERIQSQTQSELAAAREALRARNGEVEALQALNAELLADQARLREDLERATSVLAAVREEYALETRQADAERRSLVAAQVESTSTVERLSRQVVELEQASRAQSERAARLQDELLGERSRYLELAARGLVLEEEQPEAAERPGDAVGQVGVGADEVEHFVRQWAARWSAAEVNGYLELYVPDYRGSAESPDGWREQRREQILAPEWIEVGVADLRVVRLSGERIRVTFVQEYRSDLVQDTTEKTLELVQRDGSWRIVREVSRPL
jgi:hypothetical protein